MAKFRFAVTEGHNPSVTKTINDNYKHSLPNCTHRKLRNNSQAAFATLSEACRDTQTGIYTERNALDLSHSPRSPLNLTLSSTIICPSSVIATLNLSNGLGAGPSIFTPSGVKPLP